MLELNYLIFLPMDNFKIHLNVLVNIISIIYNNYFFFITKMNIQSSFDFIFVSHALIESLDVSRPFNDRPLSPIGCIN